MQTISELRAAIKSLGFTEIDGTPTLTSQFGHDYYAVVNGYVKEEGAHARALESVPSALQRTYNHFSALGERGYHVIVWRVEPEIDEKVEHVKTYCRLHPLRKLPHE